ncbi:MAG: T9SS type A sorting domain-containing protein [candidate division KSB1 bacterium]|nr:T9SS type A sorting domain-containing protein [candidate division KSB1 bacterium]
MKKGEFTVMEKFALAHVPTGVGEVKNGSLKGMFVYCRHQPLWADRVSAAEKDADLKKFGNFPRIPGSFLYSQAFAYNRSYNPSFKDSVLKDMNLIADGLEQQRSMLYVKYYPYLYPVSFNGTFDQCKNSQNDRLGKSVMRASYFMNQAAAHDTIIEKLNTIGQATSHYYPIVVDPYHGPSMVTNVIPEHDSTVSDSIVTLSWFETDGADSYDVYVSQNSEELRSALTHSLSFVGNTSDTSWTLTNLETEKEYFWVVDAVGKHDIRKGEIYCFKVSEVSTFAEDGEKNKLISKCKLEQNYPNPFNPSTTISYSMQNPGRVLLKVYNISGETVAILVDEFQSAGKHEVKWKANGLSSGIYFYKLQTNTFTEIRKLILQR